MSRHEEIEVVDQDGKKTTITCIHNTVTTFSFGENGFEDHDGLKEYFDKDYQPLIPVDDGFQSVDGNKKYKMPSQY